MALVNYRAACSNTRMTAAMQLRERKQWQISTWPGGASCDPQTGISDGDCCRCCCISLPRMDALRNGG